MENQSREENPDIVHNDYPNRISGNLFISGITSTASAASIFVHDLIYPKK